MSKYVNDILNVNDEKILQDNILNYRVINLISGVGSGKTTWVRALADVEIDDAKFNILYITSRRAVIDAEVGKSAKAATWLKLDDYIELISHGTVPSGQVLIYCTNSRIEHFLTNAYNPDDEKYNIFKIFDFIIFDEAHALSTDATFTDSAFHMDRLITFIANNETLMPRCHVVMMTGTPEPIKWFSEERFIELSKKGLYKEYDLFKVCRHVEPENVCIIEKKYATDKLIELVQQNEKVIYFTKSTTNIVDIYSALINSGLDDKEIGISYSNSDRDILFDGITKESVTTKRNYVKAYLAEHEELPPEMRVFLTTSKNKEGINIHNEDISIMFAESNSRADLKQMVGRVRNDSCDNQIRKFFVVYDEAFSGRNMRIEEFMAQTVLNDMTNGYENLAIALASGKDHFEISDKFIKDRYIKKIEDQFPLMRYDRILSRSFVWYTGRYYGNKQSTEDYCNLHAYVDAWDIPHFQESFEAPSYTGGEMFHAWFPYSTVICTVLTPSEATRLFAEIIHKWFNERKLFGTIMSESQANEFIEYANNLIDIIGDKVGVKRINTSITSTFTDAARISYTDKTPHKAGASRQYLFNKK